MLTTSDLAKDGGAFAFLSAPLAILSTQIDLATILTVVNLVVVAALRFYEINKRSRERLEMARLRVAAGLSPDEPESARRVGLFSRARPAQPKNDEQQ